MRCVKCEPREISLPPQHHFASIKKHQHWHQDTCSLLCAARIRSGAKRRRTYARLRASNYDAPLARRLIIAQARSKATYGAQRLDESRAFVIAKNHSILNIPVSHSWQPMGMRVSQEDATPRWAALWRSSSPSSSSPSSVCRRGDRILVCPRTLFARALGRSHSPFQQRKPLKCSGPLKEVCAAPASCRSPTHFSLLRIASRETQDAKLKRRAVDVQASLRSSTSEGKAKAGRKARLLVSTDGWGPRAQVSV